MNEVESRRFVPIESHKDYTKIDYEIDSYSTYSATYTPDQIKMDRPMDQACRWSSAINDQNQFLLLRLPAISLIRTITFGKFHKVHVCNLKEFKVELGLTKDTMKLVLHSGLRNDSESETFPIEDGLARWIKIVPLVPWGGNFNFSIWYLELRGFEEKQESTQRTLQKYLNSTRTKEWQKALSLFRENGIKFDHSLSTSYENPLIAALYDLIVVRGDFVTAEEQFVHSSLALYQSYVDRKAPFTAKWTRLDLPDHNGTITGIPSPLKPCARGGHQMVFDPISRRLLLFGGWEGHKDLSDLWSFDPTTQQWTCISTDCQREGGPGPRSCHKMAIDASKRIALVIGRYIDPDNTNEIQTNSKSELYLLNLEDMSWSILCSDTAAAGGPPLIYDHQMCIDEERGVVYVFGGRFVTNKDKDKNSGLYSFNLETMTWRLLRSDEFFPRATPHFRARIGHSMCWDPSTRSLIIFSGQRNKDYLSDLYVYSVDTDTVAFQLKDVSREGGPDPGFTQRACLDLSIREMFLFSGLFKDSTGSRQELRGSSNIWAWQLDRHQWQKITSEGEEPVARYAHQIAFDQESRLFYLFGGNPGVNDSTPKEIRNTRRLDDFWQLEIKKSCNGNDILRRIRFLLRRQQFREMCLSEQRDNRSCLHFLQANLSEVVDHTKGEESSAFRSLSNWLFRPPIDIDYSNNLKLLRLSTQGADPVVVTRHDLFEEIISLLCLN